MNRTGIIKSIVFAAVALAMVGAWAETEKVGDYTWIYCINGDTAEIYNDYSAAISPTPTGSVTVPTTLGGMPVTSIGSYAFVHCSGLTNVTIPDSVTNIGSDAFFNCSGLTNVTIPDSVTSIGSSAFYNCSGLTNVTIGNGVTSIGSSTFSLCTCLTSITIPDGLTSIGYSAFSGCSGLTSITIPNSVTNIEATAFSSCNGLTSVHISDLAAWCQILFNDYFANPLKYAHNLYLNGALITNLTIPSGVTCIRNYAFYNCSSLMSVTIPESVTSIGSSAFSGCSGLTSVTIPNSVTNIGPSAFSGCSGLPSVTIPDSVTDLSTTAFDGCGKLWTAWYRTLANSSASGGGSASGTDPRYALSSVAADRTVASVTVDGDTAIDSFVLTDGKVYDTALYVVNSSASEVRLSLPGGYVYITPKGKTPLAIPANSMNLLTITRLAERTFLVSRQLLEIVK